MSGTGDDETLPPCIQSFCKEEQEEIISIAKTLAGSKSSVPLSSSYTGACSSSAGGATVPSFSSRSSTEKLPSFMDDDDEEDDKEV